MPKSKQKKEMEIPKVDLIERIPSGNVDLKALADYCHTSFLEIKKDRSSWEERRAEYFQDIDNFVNYYTAKDLPFDDAANIHIPVTLEKQRAVHARFYQAIFGVRPPFWVEPQESMDESRVKDIYQLMKWAITRYVNYYKGIYEQADEFLWNFSSEGWSAMRLAWTRKVRKALVVEEVESKSAEPGMQTDQSSLSKFKEVMKWIPVFEGPVVETIQNEDFYMPGRGGIQNCPFVAIATSWTAHQLSYYAKSSYFDSKAVENALPFSDHISTYSSESEIKNVKGDNQGYELNAPSNKQKDHNLQIATYDGLEVYCTYDIDGDGFDEELVVYFHPSSRQILRWTYLDRITSTGRRPLYKADFIIRPGRNYALGLCELLHSLSIEVDAIHNQRVDFGTLSNMPFFFYKAMSSMPNQTISISPGKGIPLEDPSSDVFFPQFRGGTSWGFQEENLLFQIINRVSAISDLNLGITPNNSEAVRSQGQMLAVLSEGNAQLDIPLRRVQQMFGEIYGDLHQMLLDKLPPQFQHVVVGEDETPIIDPRTEQVVMKQYQNPRKEVAGRVHFHIQANSTAGSKALMRNNRLELFQQLMNPINLQLGIVGPEEVYAMNKKLLEVSDEPETKSLLRKPESVPKPLSLTDEIAMLQQGLMPEIPMNDDHVNKAQALISWIQHRSTIEGMRNGIINVQALTLAEVAIQTHAKYAQLIASQQQMFQNKSGSQLPMPGAGGALGGMGGIGQAGPKQNLPPNQGPGPNEVPPNG